MSEPELDWIQIDTKGWGDLSEQLEEQGLDTNLAKMYVKENVMLSIALNKQPSDFPEGIDRIREMINYFAVQQVGILISADIVDLGKVSAVQSILKYGIPDISGFRFAAGLIICYKDFFYSISIEAQETGFTGVRESVMMTALQEKGEIKAPVFEKDKYEVDISDWTRHPYGDQFHKDTQVKYNLSDRAEYDERFPEHPLSQVRTGLTAIINSIQISDQLDKFEVYHLK